MIEAMKQALEALESSDWYIDLLEMIVYSADDNGTHEERTKVQQAITSLRQAIAEFDSHTLYREGYVNGYAFGEAAGRKAVAEKQDGACQHCAGKGCVACDAREQEPDKYEMDIECTKCGAKQSGVLTVHTYPPQRTEQSFCPRCGKRTNDIHTCTPPRD